MKKTKIVNNKKIDIIFLVLREEEPGHKDIDHLLPILYFLNKSKFNKFKITLVILENEARYKKNIDKRLSYLFKFKNLNIKFLYKNNTLFKIKQLLDLNENQLFVRYINRLFHKFYLQYISSKIKNLNFNNLVGKVFSKSKYPLIFTLHSNYKSEVLVNNLKKINNKAKWVVLPHGTLIANNKMLIDSDLNKKEFTKSKNKNSKFDFYLYTSKYDVNIKALSKNERKKYFLIGSPRYCEEWLKTKSNLGLDGKVFLRNKNNKIKALFFLPKRNANIFWDEVIRTIDFISSYQKIELIILNYNSNFPKFPDYLKKKSNIKFFLISREYSTSKLIEWSDVIFHSGSSVIFEFFLKDKISIFLRYLTCNTLISDKYNSGLNLSNRDELRFFCNSVVSSLKKVKKDYKYKSSSANKKFINDFVSVNSKSVPENIKKCIYKISKTF